MNDTIAHAFTTRAAIKVFDASKPVSEANLNTILEAARMAPTAYGLQPYRLIHVKDAELRKQLQAAAFGQGQVVDAAELVVVAARTDIDEAFVDEYIARIAETRGVAVADLKGFRDMMVGDICGRSVDERAKWAGRQAYIGLGSMIETAALIGVDGCPMEGFMPGKVDEILGLYALKLASLGFFAIGYRGADQASQMKKVRVAPADFVITK
jgi:nitroreductase